MPVVSPPPASAEPRSEDGADPSLISRRGLEIVAAIATLAFGGIIVAGAIEYNVGWGDRGPEPGYFPFWIGLIVMTASAVNLMRAVRDRGENARTAAITRGQLFRIAAFAGPMLVFLVLTLWLGLYVAMALYLFGVMWLQGGYRLPAALAVAVGSALVTFVLFERLLKVPLLKGPLEAWLGLH